MRSNARVAPRIVGHCRQSQMCQSARNRINARRRSHRRAMLRSMAVIATMIAAMAVVSLWGTSELAVGARAAQTQHQLAQATGDAAPSARKRDLPCVTVAPGDTLWSIAKRVAGENVDPRQVTKRIQELNYLTSPLIHAGQTLRVPSMP
ncbi:MAG: LysM peptidoglycan-binding domain-containing protein [Clostridia bacterium]|nr:LysM peptidoglycan-binding domain-containing protein [Clostridia bacterium]